MGGGENNTKPTLGADQVLYKHEEASGRRRRRPEEKSKRTVQTASLGHAVGPASRKRKKTKAIETSALVTDGGRQNS